MALTSRFSTSPVFADDPVLRRLFARIMRFVVQVTRAGDRAPARRLSLSPTRAPGTTTSSRINRLLRSRDSDYLEIGVWQGHTLEAVLARRRVGVDPLVAIDVSRLPTGLVFHNCSSDEFFATHSDLFDAVLIDGLHEAGQAYRDVRNALIRLNRDGFVLVDDVAPPDECAAAASETEARRCTEENGRPWLGVWTGDVYRAVWALANTSKNLDFRTIVAGGQAGAQTLVWWSRYHADGADREACLPEEIDPAARQLNWVEEFRYGVPRWMRPATRKEAEASYRAGVSRPTAGAGGSPLDGSGAASRAS